MMRRLKCKIHNTEQPIEASISVTEASSAEQILLDLFQDIPLLQSLSTQELLAVLASFGLITGFLIMCLPWFKKSKKKPSSAVESVGIVTSASATSLKQHDSVRRSPTNSIKTLSSDKPLHLASKTTPDTSHKAHTAK